MVMQQLLGLWFGGLNRYLLRHLRTCQAHTRVFFQRMTLCFCHAGKTITFDAIETRYVRYYSSRNSINVGVHFIEINVMSTERRPALVTTLWQPASGSTPGGVACSPDGQFLVFSDTTSNCIRKILLADGSASILAGTCAGGSAGFQDGVAGVAKFQNPTHIQVRPNGLTAWVTDKGNNAMRVVTIATGEVRTLWGLDSDDQPAWFRNPRGISVMRVS